MDGGSIECMRLVPQDFEQKMGAPALNITAREPRGLPPLELSSEGKT